MKVLIEASTYNHKLYHSLALGLKDKIKKKIEFGIIRYDLIAKKFLKNQKDIDYTFFENDSSKLNHLLIKNKKKFLEIKKNLPNADLTILSEFQESLDGKSIWKIVSSDRFLGRSFLTGVVGYDNEFSNDRDFILKVI